VNNKSLEKFAAIIKAYDYLVGGIEKQALDNTERAFGGIIRAGKGRLVESIAKNLIEIAWENIGNKTKRLTIGREQVKIRIKSDYVDKIKNKEVKEYIRNNISAYIYSLSTDIHVQIDNKLAIGVECKAYTENAMMKRILVDFTLLKQYSPDMDCVLFQLESQLGGDYSELKETSYGSHSTHTLLSYFDIDLNIITLLKGERKVDKPIHNHKYFKPLIEDNLQKAVKVFQTLLEKHI